jgi:hypothetical protein
MENTSSAQYWIVGAVWREVDKYPEFIRRGYWMLGWTEQEQPVQAALRDKVQVGDRIAIKRLLGQGASEMEIRALGIVKEVDLIEKRIYVDWVVPNLSRHVPSKGLFAAIHEPFLKEDDWIRLVFQL